MAHEENQGNDLPLLNMSTLVTYNPYFIVTVGSLISFFFLLLFVQSYFFSFFFFFLCSAHPCSVFIFGSGNEKQTNK